MNLPCNVRSVVRQRTIYISFLIVLLSSIQFTLNTSDRAINSCRRSKLYFFNRRPSIYRVITGDLSFQRKWSTVCLGSLTIRHFRTSGIQFASGTRFSNRNIRLLGGGEKKLEFSPPVPLVDSDESRTLESFRKNKGEISF